MGTSVSRAALTRTRNAIAAIALSTLALGLLPATSFAVDDETVGAGFVPAQSEKRVEAATPNSILASTLTPNGVSVISADVALGDGAASEGLEPIIGSFTVDGLTFAVNADGGVTFMAVSPDVILSVGNAVPGVEGSLSIPQTISYNGVTYPVTAVGPYAFYLSDATQVEFPASITSIDDRAFRSSDVEYVTVATDNPNIASFDGALYSADLSSLLLIPEGRTGVVLLPSETEVADSSKFSHCSLVEAIDVEEGDAAFASWDGLLYDASGTTLLRVPAGAVDITIREGCTTIASGAMEGCAKLERINAPSTVTSISPNVFESVPMVSLPSNVLLSVGSEAAGVEGSPAQLTAMVALSANSDDVFQVSPRFITVVLPKDVSCIIWSGFDCITEIDPDIEPVVSLEKGSTYSASAMSWTSGWGLITPASTIYYKNPNGTGKWEDLPTYEFHRMGGATQGKVSLNSSGRVTLSQAGGATWYWGLNSSLTGVDKLEYSYDGSSWTTVVAGASAVSLDTSKPLVLSLNGARPKWTVTFTQSPGSGGTASTEVIPGSSIGTITKPTLSGWTFRGYTDDMTTNTYLYVNSSGVGTSRTITSDRTLQANWTKTVSFNANGGTAGSLTSLTAGIRRVLGQKCSQVSSTNPDYPIRILFNKGITDKADWAPTRAGYTFAGFYDTSASTGGTCYVNASGVAQSVCNPVTFSMPSTLYARWSPVVSATMPLEVTVRIDLLGVDEQGEAASYIESLCGEPLKVTDAEFEPLAGAATLFGTDVGSVSLVGFPGTSTTPLFTFALDTAGAESNAEALSPLTMASYGTRIPIRYRFDIPDELLPALTETTLPVCQVSYTVALA